MKPREKVVTAEDVQNSLYFIHVDSPEDDRFITNAPPRDSNNELQPQMPVIQRKAVPNTSTVAGAQVSAQRRPLPGTTSPLNDHTNRQNVPAVNQTHLSSNYLGPDYTPRRSLDSHKYQIENERPHISARRHSEQARSPGTSLTLIRRDPASGAQWNIARVDDPPVLGTSSSAFDDGSLKKPIGAPLYIDITNPGYSKFLHSEQNQTAQDPQERSRGFPNVFHRRLWMEGAGIPHGGFGHQRLSSHDSNMSTGSPRPSFEGFRHTSAETRSSLESQSHNIYQTSEKHTSFRGYVFMSPWNGRCEFTTGAGGGSLKVITNSLLHIVLHMVNVHAVPTYCPRSSGSGSRGIVCQ